MNKKAAIGIIGLLLLAIALADQNKDQAERRRNNQEVQRDLNHQIDYWLESNTIQSKLRSLFQPREEKNHDA